MKIKFLNTTLLGLALAATSLTSNATLIVNKDAASIAYTVSSSDLINDATALITGAALSGKEGTSSDVTTLTNGAFGTSGSPLDSAETVSISNNTVLTYLFDTTLNTLGFDITGINTFGGWRDTGRDNQNYEVLFSMVDNPLLFTSLASISFSQIANSTTSTRVSIGDSSGILASGVAAVRFSFGAQENGYAGYRELDIIGTATVPEPTSLVIFALGIMGLATRRFKNQS
jgi:hypothetical protein